MRMAVAALLGALVLAIQSPLAHPSLPQPSASPVSDLQSGDTASVRIERVRLEAAPAVEGASAVDVKFNVVNAGSQSLADIVVEISLLKMPDARRPVTHRTMLAGPFTLRSKIALQPGFTINVETRLRNLSLNCHCVPGVRVLSAAAAPDTSQEPQRAVP